MLNYSTLLYLFAIILAATGKQKYCAGGLKFRVLKFICHNKQNISQEIKCSSFLNIRHMSYFYRQIFQE